jgi:hypothetical protein
MPIDQARAILDAARAGQPVSEALITRALMRTGDITPLTFGEIRVAERIPMAAFAERLAA